MIRAPEAPPYSRSLALSVAAHAAFLCLIFLIPQIISLIQPPAPPPPLEIEITDPYLGDGPRKLGAPKPLTPGVQAKVNLTAATPPETPKPTPAVKPPEPPKDWVLPNPSTKVDKPETPSTTGSAIGTGITTTPGGAAGGEGTAAKVGGSGEGSDDGVPGGHGHGGTPLKAFPRLLNRDEVFAALRRLYPERERAANHEGDVLALIHIGADGDVGRVDIRRSAGTAFDDAARKVGLLMRFSPAIGLDGRPTPVALPQPIEFRLTN